MKRAFTLIELLVVIAIIAILAAILFPVFAQAKSAAKKSVCLSNAKQLSTAFAMYTSDNDDTYGGNLLHVAPWQGGGYGLPNGFLDPGADTNWGAQLYGYVKSIPVMICPSSPKAQFSEDWAPGLNFNPAPGAANTSYIFNGALAFKSATQTSNPAGLVMLRDGAATGKVAVSRPGNPSNTSSTSLCFNIDDTDLGANHDGGGNLGFADGHGKYMKRQALTYANLGMSRDGADCTWFPCNLWYTDVASGGDTTPSGHEDWLAGNPEDFHLPKAGGWADNWSWRTCNLDR